VRNASDTVSLQAELKKNNYYPVKLTLIKEKKKNEFFAVSSRVKPDEVIGFLRQFSVMIRAGIPISDSINSLRAQKYSTPFRNVLRTVYFDIESGVLLSEAFAKHPKVFPRFFVNMVAIGEASSSLDKVLVSMANYYENDRKIKKKAKSSMVYPTLLLVMVFVVLLFGSVSLKATEQEPDYIVYEGKMYRLETYWAYPSPMEIYFIRTGRGNFFKENAVVISSGNWRAHVATWEIRNNKLYLTEVSVDYIAGVEMREYEKGNFIEWDIIRDTTHKPGYYSIKSLNGQPEEADGAVFADWFSGMLEIDNRGANSKWNDEYKGMRYVYIKDGKVVDDQLLTKEDFDRISKFTEQDTADHELADKYRINCLRNNYLSYWIQSGTYDIMLYNGEEIKNR
jgi:hypothetical protein